MFPTFQMGRLFGIPLEIRTSFLVMLGAVLLFTGGLSGVLIVLLAFGSVILHELGHALVARNRGVDVSGIALHFFGGVAKMVRQPQSAKDEAWIAAAGPAVSFAIGLWSWGMALLTGTSFFGLLAGINVFIGLFNLIPALPMDGGRILRALLSSHYGFGRATEIAIRVSRVTAIGFAIVGLAMGHIQLLLLSGVVWVMGSAELRNSQRGGGYRAGGAEQSPLVGYFRVYRSDSHNLSRTPTEPVWWREKETQQPRSWSDFFDK